jgi:hypothetical protein
MIMPKGSSCNGKSFPGTFDCLERFFFARVNKRLSACEAQLCSNPESQE